MEKRVVCVLRWWLRWRNVSCVCDAGVCVVPSVLLTHTSTHCLGLSSDKSQLLYMAHCPETQRDVKLPFTMLMAASTMTLTTRLQDTHLYVLQRAVLASILAEHPGWQCLATQVVPHIIAHQVRLPDGEGFASVKSTSASLTLGTLFQVHLGLYARLSSLDNDVEHTIL